VSAGKVRNMQLIREKYSEKPEGQRPLASAKAEEFIVFAIDYTGPVIPEKEQEGLFTTFFHTEAPLSGDREGLRIGLALCKRFIELHGGTIWVENLSASGLNTAVSGNCECAGETGNRFIFVLPQRPTDDKLMQGS